MIHFLADENFNGKILRGVRRERPNTHIVRVQDTPLYQSSDPDILRWAAEHRIIDASDPGEWANLVIFLPL